LPFGTAGNGREDVEDRGRGERRGQRGALTVDEDIDVLPQRRARLAQAVPHPRPAAIQLADGIGHGRGLHLDLSGRAREEGDERPGQAHDRHAAACQSLTTAASTDQTSGSRSAIIDQVSPPSELAKIWPVLVPK
jgi:hypothetical protein